MDVIFDATDDDGGRIVVATDTSQIGVHFGSDVQIREERLAVFRGKNDVHVDL